MIISGMLVRVKLPPFFPFLSKLSSTLKLLQFLNGLSCSDELGGKLKVFPCIFHNTFHLECHGHKQIIIFALTHGSETEILLVKKQVEERLLEYGQMQVVTTPAENSYLVFEKGEFTCLLIHTRDPAWSVKNGKT